MIQSIERAMMIINVLAEHPKRFFSVQEIFSETELPTSTIYRLLYTLETFDLVERNEEKKEFRLGYTWLQLGMKMYHDTNIREKAHPLLEELAYNVRETTYLNIPKQFTSIIIDRVDSPKNVRIIDMIGEKIPYPIGAANKVLLAFSKKGIQTQFLEKIDEQDREELIEQLYHIKEKGYSISYGEKTKGTVSVAAPVFDLDGEPIAAISAECFEYDTDVEKLDSIAKQVTQTAHLLSHELGHT
ncbi:IclR family transcriptional regulator [Lysinibacillus agricola]|uniref:IclR family transcriptional regulator n=1 Tax=Lysinibacillus agricola TaxID=2590012 RepID=A0ABX7AS76_9BACI|nr:MULTISPECIES: IclR family transcriptional regulator [Lysinibacillus]KOS60559.1 IclR family transcriptional regulator [Lysinibacillus sp. FJAT-14222]QQP12807.1 IclR family transcriptional regulator [Lysinibacillus agricola]